MTDAGNAQTNDASGPRCQKMNRVLTGEDPSCPDPKLYCKFRPGCLIFNKHLLD